MIDDNSSVRLIGLNAEHDGEQVCNHLNLTLFNSQLVVLAGADPRCIDSLMRMIAGIMDIPDGEIELWGLPISRINRRSLESRVCFVPRHRHPTFAYSVFDFVMQGCEPRMKALETPDDSDRQRARQILSLMSIERLVNRDSSLLTNRERQLVVLARALMQNAKLMLVEQPFDDLTDEDRQVISKLLKDHVNRLHSTVVISVSDPLLAISLADRLLIFNGNGLVSDLNHEMGDYLDQAKRAFSDLGMLESRIDDDDDIFADILKTAPPEEPDDKLF